MLPDVVEDLIMEYLEQINDVLNLPNYRAVKRLINKSNDYVLRSLGFVLDLPSDDLIRIRYRITFDCDFIFYFRLSPIQRIHLITMLERGMFIDPATSCLVWMFVSRKSKLLNYPKYRKLFLNSLLCHVLSRVRSMHSIF